MRRKAAVLLTVPEAGRALGVSISTVWRMIRRGTLPSLRKGGRRWVLQSALRYRRAASRTVERIEDLPPFTREHPIFKLIGAFRSSGTGPGSSDKHEILDE